MRSTALCCALVLSLAPAFARAQEGMPPMPKPGPEHELLKQDVGTWDASVESWMDPAKPPMVSKGSETNTMGPGGLWLIQDFTGDMMGTKFEGHGTAGYDPGKKLYVSTWIDSMTTWPSIGTAHWDAAAKTMTGEMEGPGPDGKPMKMKSMMKYEGADKRIFTMSMPGPDGKDMTAMRITYTRRK